jgi:purine-nucleoside phosphorylase
MVLDSHLDFLWPRVHEQHCEWSRLLARRCSQENRYVSLRNGDAPYDWRLIQMLHSIAQREGIKLHQGCYLGTLGPTYETRSEYRMFRWLGADAVGMSTIPEVLAAKSLQMQVLALSVITNVACPDLPQSTTHQEVVDSGRAAGPRLLTLISGLLQQMAGPPD